MAEYFGKQPSSRPLITSTSTTTPTKSAAQTYQLRVVNISTAAATLNIADSSSTSVGVNVNIPGGAAGNTAEYFSITPGQFYLPGPNVIVTEMS